MFFDSKLKWENREREESTNPRQSFFYWQMDDNKRLLEVRKGRRKRGIDFPIGKQKIEKNGTKNKKKQESNLTKTEKIKEEKWQKGLTNFIRL